ncbi:oxidation resistance protein 1-like isoform X1 [Amphibalanus amphitrite]|uniref:oxidation resistance protein 1-like isoform X1 n=1 Tax=Amphibalanus amphitrite TaxID=1232801 RepID=UPI001C90BD18|nr:oxidation resistance protein 1-like isoform X1 [Amphibalanus amphitrite]
MAEGRDPTVPRASEAPLGSGSGSGSGSGRRAVSGSVSVPRSRRSEDSYEPGSLSQSVDSCLSAGELCRQEERMASMSDSLYSTASDVTLVGECSCPAGAPCLCGAVKDLGEEVSSSTDSGASVRECASSRNGSGAEKLMSIEAAANCEREGREKAGKVLKSDTREEKGRSRSVGRDNNTPTLPVVTIHDEAATAAAEDDDEATPRAPAAGRPSAPVTASGGSGLRVPEPERTRRLSLDSSGILAAAFHQSEQFHELNDARDDRPVSFVVSGGADRSQSRSTSASESRSDEGEGGDDGGDDEDVVDDDSRSDNELEQALYQFHHQRRESLTSASDVSVQELELETTGDFPHDFQFPGAGGSSRHPPAVWPSEAEAARRLAERVGMSNGSRSRRQAARRSSEDRGRRETAAQPSRPPVVPAVVIEPADEPAASAAAAPPPARPPPVRRGLLARLVDSTAAFLLGGMQDDGGDRRHRSYTVSASDYRRSAAAAAAAAARRAAAEAGEDPTASPAGSAEPDAASTSSRSPVLGQVEEPATVCRQCQEPSCSPEVACQRPLARRLSVHSDDRPVAIISEQRDGLLAPPTVVGGGGGGVGSDRPPSAEGPTDERRKMRQQAMQNDLRVNVTYHNVKPGETIPSIAAFYECLPGELKELNRLQFKKTILPGQVLRVLDRRSTPEPTQSQGGGDADQEPPSDSGGLSIRHRSRSTPSGSHGTARAGDDTNGKQHIQIRRTRLFTESEGVAVGTLIMTPNSLMFRPNVSDPLVVDRGVEYYTVDVPVRYLVTAEYYTEPPHHSPAAASQHREAHRESFSSKEKRRSSAPDPTTSEGGAKVETSTTDDSHITVSGGKRPCSTSSDDGQGPEGSTTALGDSKPSSPQKPKTDTGSKPDPGEPGDPGSPEKRNDSSPAGADRSPSSPASAGEAKRPAYGRGSRDGRASFSAPPPPQEGDEEYGSPLSSVIPIVSSVSSATEGSECSLPLSTSLRSQGSVGVPSPAPEATATGEAQDDKQNTEAAERAKTIALRKGSTGSEHSLKNEIAFDEKPSLFKAADELLRVHTPVVSQPPLYLEMVTGKTRGRLLPRSERTKVMFCGQRRLPSRVLFAVPRDRCEELHQFITQWTPELSDDVDLTTKLQRQGFEQIDSDDDIWEPEELEGDWEEVDFGGYPLGRGTKAGEAADGPAQPAAPPSPLDAAFLPELVGNTELLTDEARLCLQRHLPARVEGHPWQLVYSASEHGFSLKSLYRQAVEFDCPMLMVVKDASDSVFGAVCTDPIRFGKHYYGTGESFLFTLRPQFRVYRWSGENQYFARGSTDCLEFGSGDGRAGLYVDEDLARGITEPCQTYNNDPLTVGKEFFITAVELWALG